MTRSNAMRLKRLIAAIALALSTTWVMAQESTAPGVGDPAPAFRLIGSDGNYYTLDQYTAKKPVVIAFFPKAFTGG